MKKSLLRRISAFAIAFVMMVPYLVTTPAQAVGGAQRLYHWVASINTTEETMASLKDNVVRGPSRSNTHWTWLLSNSTATTVNGDPVTHGYWVRNSTTSGYGLPSTNLPNNKTKATSSLDFQFTNFPTTPTRDLEAVNLSMTYIYSPSLFDTPVFALDKLAVSVSVDGETWLDGHVGMRSWTLLGSAKDPSGQDMMIFNIETDNFFDIPGLKPGDRLRNIRIQPHGDFYYTFGFFSVYDMTVNGYATLEEFNTLVPDQRQDYLEIGEQTMRDIVVEHGKMIADTAWVSDSTIYTDSPSGTSADATGTTYMTYEAGLPFRGPAYLRTNKPDYEVWRESIKDGKWVGANTTGAAMGMDCMVFAYDCYSRVSRSHSWVIWQTQSDNALQLLGNLKTDGSPVFTNTDIFPHNSAQDIYEGYAQLKKGDIITAYTTTGSIHIRIVYSDPVIVRNSDGTINPDKSYLSAIEQGSSSYYHFKTSSGEHIYERLANSKAMQDYLDSHPGYELLYVSAAPRVDYKYTFADCYNTYYVPLTLAEYATGKVENIDVQMQLGAKNNNIRNGFRADIAADYHIAKVDIKLEDLSQGTVLYTDTEIGNHTMNNNPPHQRNYTWNYDNANLNALLGKLENGNYRISVSVMAGPVTTPRASHPITTQTYEFSITDKAPTAEVTLRPSATVSADQNTNVQINVNTRYDAADVEVKYDIDKLTFVSGTGAAGINSVTGENGVVRITIANAQGASGSIGTLTFKAKEDLSPVADSIEVKSAFVVAAGGTDVQKATKSSDSYPSINFNDVSKNAWYREAVDFVLTNNVMSGYSSTTFGPNNTLSRAMVVQVLYNKEGQPTTTDPNPFPDVPANEWYNNAVRWGAARKVVAGYGGGVFKPDDNVTIEQVAVILWNYSGTPESSATLDDVGDCSDWAQNALRWCVEKGILSGVPYSAVTDPATRAQTAQMLTNYLTKA